MKNLILYSVIILAFFATSCSDFLEEESKLTKTEDLVYNNPDAIEGLCFATYSYTRLWYGKEMAVYLSEGGTDLWYPAKDNGVAPPASFFTTYNGLQADISFFDQMWELLYTAVNTCNTAEDQLNKTDYFTEDYENQLMAEVRFMRAFYYWHIVETWGPAQLNIEPTKEPVLLFTRNSEEEIYMQMFDDVQFAIDNLDPAELPSSRVTWLAAKAFKARLALYWASAYYGHTEYYATAAQEAKDVLAASAGLEKSLNPDYKDVWDISKNNIADNSEFIWGVDYFDEITPSVKWSDYPLRLDGVWDKVLTRADDVGQGNDLHLFWCPIWNNQSTDLGGPGVTDVLVRSTGTSKKMYTVASPSEVVVVNLDQHYVKYAMGYTRLGPTLYCLDLFDETVDQRWEGTFRSAWYKHPDVVPKNYPDPETCSYPLMSTGTDTDTALFFSKRPLTPSQIAWAEGRYKAMDVTMQFDDDGIPTPSTSDGGAVMYNHMNKFENTDTDLENIDNFNNYFSYRDFPVFRLSEMYLIAAEALIGVNDAEAVDIVNELRQTRAIEGKDMTVSGVDIDLILEERAREFAGEGQRWFDLKRTKKLEEQVQNNPSISNFFDPAKHYLRPIPSVQIQASTNFDDASLQNPGY